MKFPITCRIPVKDHFVLVSFVIICLTFFCLFLYVVFVLCLFFFIILSVIILSLFFNPLLTTSISDNWQFDGVPAASPQCPITFKLLKSPFTQTNTSNIRLMNFYPNLVSPTARSKLFIYRPLSFGLFYVEIQSLNIQLRFRCLSYANQQTNYQFRVLHPSPNKIP